MNIQPPDRSEARRPEQSRESPGALPLSTPIQEIAAAKGRWVALVEHELRTPLAVIAGHVEMLAEHGAVQVDSQLRVHVDALARNTGRLTTIVEHVVLMH